MAPSSATAQKAYAPKLRALQFRVRDLFVAVIRKVNNGADVPFWPIRCGRISSERAAYGS